MSTKEVILARLGSGPQTKDDLLVDFTEAASLRGAASVLAYLVRSGQVAVDESGNYRATGASPRKDPAQAKPKKKRQAPPPVVETVPDEDETPIEIPAALDMAIWSTGELTLNRAGVGILMAPAEVRELVEFLGRVGAIEETA